MSVCKFLTGTANVLELSEMNCPETDGQAETKSHESNLRLSDLGCRAKEGVEGKKNWDTRDK